MHAKCCICLHEGVQFSVTTEMNHAPGSCNFNVADETAGWFESKLCVNHTSTKAQIVEVTPF